MGWLEWTAAALILVNVALAARRSILNYPFGIVASALYFVIFWQAKLYGGALLQILFIAAQIYGWWNWRRFAAAGELPVERMGWKERGLWFAGFTALALVWGGIMSALTDARVPFPDAALSSASIACQLLVALRRVEGWVVWIGVNIGAISLFASQGFYATVALYVVLLALSVLGLRSWFVASQRNESVPVLAD